ncbi:hypothetical protein HMPREF0497_2897 [Lentilactobacillus buchneri ATCC 11577]|nr:hypothetical protein HMPREF0497_2897 [Lentilactobacillus buchneri ATCC 11577]
MRNRVNYIKYLLKGFKGYYMKLPVPLKGTGSLKITFLIS